MKQQTTKKKYPDTDLSSKEALFSVSVEHKKFHWHGSSIYPLTKLTSYVEIDPENSFHSSQHTWGVHCSGHGSYLVSHGKVYF